MNLNSQDQLPCSEQSHGRNDDRPQQAEFVPGSRFLLHVIGGVPVVVTPMEIDISNSIGLRTALLSAPAQQTGTLVVDMSRTEFCDSSGLNVIVRAHERARDEGWELLLVVCTSAVMRIFAVTGIDRLIPIFANLEQALKQAQDISGQARPEERPAVEWPSGTD